MDNLSSYTDENFPRKFLQGYSIFPDDSRNFHRLGFQYDAIANLQEAEFADGRLTVKAFLASGEESTMLVEAVAPQVLRIRLYRGETLPLAPGGMILPLPQARPVTEFHESENTYAFSLGGYRLDLERGPFCMRIYSSSGEMIFASETEKLVGLYTAPPLGLRRKDGAAWAFLSWYMRNEDRFYGLGEKFTRFEKTSSRATIWEADTCGSNACDMSYKAVPVLFSTAGWGMLLHSAYRSYWEIGSFSYNTGSVLVEQDSIDLFLILAPSLKEQIQIYTSLTGRVPLIPKWALGVWMSKAPYRDRAEMREVAGRLRAESIPCDVFNVDPTWMRRNYYDDLGVEVCNFNWDEINWGKEEDFFAEFTARGYAVCLWINPYFSEDSPAYAEAREKGYLARSPAGGVSRLEFGLAAGIVDFTNPAARAWWQEKLKALLHKGAAAFKVDFGDRIPEDAIFYNGRSGLEMHNLYVHLYAEAVFEAVQQVRGVGLIWRRPGYIGSQRFPGSWAGDTQVTWEGMQGALRGGLSAAMTGEVFWSHDIGGFVGSAPSPELYIRWAQFGLLSPLARFHGMTPREPWHYGEAALGVVRHYAGLRYRLVPYLLASAWQSTQSGLPLLRPMALEYPGEPHIDQVDDQYLLGEDLLVAPVFQAGARSRWIYFPAGRWWALENPGEYVDGPGYREVEAPLERLPLYARAGAVIPGYIQAPQHLKDPAPKEWSLDIYPGDVQRELTIPETGFSMQIEYQCQDGNIRLEISPAPVELTVRLIGREAGSVQAAIGGPDWQTGEGCVQTVLDASKGLGRTWTSTAVP